jgi:hypothetical protein
MKWPRTISPTTANRLLALQVPLGFINLLIYFTVAIDHGKITRDLHLVELFCGRAEMTHQFNLNRLPAEGYDVDANPRFQNFASDEGFLYAAYLVAQLQTTWK